MKLFSSISRFWLALFFGCVISGAIVSAASPFSDDSEQFQETFENIKSQWDSFSRNFEGFKSKQQELAADSFLNDAIAVNREAKDLWETSRIQQMEEAVEVLAAFIKKAGKRNPEKDYVSFSAGCDKFKKAITVLKRNFGVAIASLKGAVSGSAQEKRVQNDFIKTFQGKFDKYMDFCTQWLDKMADWSAKLSVPAKALFSSGESLKNKYKTFSANIKGFKEKAQKLVDAGIELEENFSVEDFNRAEAEDHANKKSGSLDDIDEFTQKLGVALAQADLYLKIENKTVNDWLSIQALVKGDASKEGAADIGLLAELKKAKEFMEDSSKGVSHFPTELDSLVKWFDDLDRGNKINFFNLRFFDLKAADVPNQKSYTNALDILRQYIRETSTVSSSDDKQPVAPVDRIDKHIQMLPDYLQPLFISQRENKLASNTDFPTSLADYLQAREAKRMQDLELQKELGVDESDQQIKEREELEALTHDELKAVLFYFWLCSTREEDQKSLDFYFAFKALEERTKKLLELMSDYAKQNSGAARAAVVKSFEPADEDSRLEIGSNPEFARLEKINPGLAFKIYEALQKKRAAQGLAADGFDKERADQDTSVPLYRGDKLHFGDERKLSLEDQEKIRKYKTLAQQLQEERNFAGGTASGRAARGQADLINNLYRDYASAKINDLFDQLSQHTQNLTTDFGDGSRATSFKTRKGYYERALKLLREFEVCGQEIDSMAAQFKSLFSDAEGKAFKRDFDAELQARFASGNASDVLSEVVLVLSSSSALAIRQLADGARAQQDIKKYQAELLWLSGMLEYVLSKKAFLKGKNAQLFEALKKKVEKPISSLLEGGKGAMRRDLLDGAGLLADFTIKELGLSPVFAGIEPLAGAVSAEQKEIKLFCTNPKVCIPGGSRQCLSKTDGYEGELGIPSGFKNDFCNAPYEAFRGSQFAQDRLPLLSGELEPNEDHVRFLLDTENPDSGTGEGYIRVREVEADGSLGNVIPREEITDAHILQIVKKLKNLAPINREYTTILERLASLDVSKTQSGMQDFDFMTVGGLQKYCAAQGGKRLSNFVGLPGSDYLNKGDVFYTFKQASAARWDSAFSVSHPLSIDQFKLGVDYFTAVRERLVSSRQKSKRTAKDLALYKQAVIMTLDAIKERCFNIDIEKESRTQNYTFESTSFTDLKDLFDTYFITGEESRISLRDLYYSRRASHQDPQQDAAEYDELVKAYDVIADSVLNDSGARILKGFSADQQALVFASWYYISKGAEVIDPGTKAAVKEYKVYKGTMRGFDPKNEVAEDQQASIFFPLTNGDVISLTDLVRSIKDGNSGTAEYNLSALGFKDGVYPFNPDEENADFYRITAPLTPEQIKARGDALSKAKARKEIARAGGAAVDEDVDDAAIDAAITAAPTLRPGAKVAVGGVSASAAGATAALDILRVEKADATAPIAPKRLPGEDLAAFQKRYADYKKADAKYDAKWKETFGKKEDDAVDTVGARNKTVKDNITRYVKMVRDLEEVKTKTVDTLVKAFLLAVNSDDEDQKDLALGGMVDWRNDVIAARNAKLDKEIAQLTTEIDRARGQARNKLTEQRGVRESEKAKLARAKNDTDIWMANIASALKYVAGKAKAAAASKAFAANKAGFAQAKKHVLANYPVDPKLLDARLAENKRDRNGLEDYQADIQWLSDTTHFYSGEHCLQAAPIRIVDATRLVFQWLKTDDEETAQFFESTSYSKPHDFYRVTHNRGIVSKVERSTVDEELKVSPFEAITPEQCIGEIIHDGESVGRNYYDLLERSINGALDEAEHGRLDFSAWDGDIRAQEQAVEDAQAQETIDEQRAIILQNYPVTQESLESWLEAPQFDFQEDLVGLSALPKKEQAEQLQQIAENGTIGTEVSGVVAVTPNVSVDGQMVFVRMGQEEDENGDVIGEDVVYRIEVGDAGRILKVFKSVRNETIWSQLVEVEAPAQGEAWADVLNADKGYQPGDFGGGKRYFEVTYDSEDDPIGVKQQAINAGVTNIPDINFR